MAKDTNRELKRKLMQKSCCGDLGGEVTWNGSSDNKNKIM